MAPAKPSFFSSVASGIKGFFKGIIAGGTVGVLTGGIVGGIVGALTLNPMSILGGIGLGAAIGGATFASIGAAAGTTTEVVRSREIGQVSGQDVANVANIAFAQGVTVGHDMTMAKAAEAHATSQHFQEMIKKQMADKSKDKSLGA
jgi:hypothetical protein